MKTEMTMKVFRIDGLYSMYFVCAYSMDQAIEVFKDYLIPIREEDLPDTKKWKRERRDQLDISEHLESSYTISECDLSTPNTLGGYSG